MGRFQQGDDLFDDEDVLRDTYTPNRMIERETEMDEYHSALKPITNGALPDNIFVYGETGVGKTLATRILLNELQEDQEEWDTVDLETFWLNCKDTTSYQAACRLTNKVRHTQPKMSPSGHSRSEIHRRLWDYVDDLDATHVLFVLDEVDSFGTDDDILYQIPRATSERLVEDTKVALIGISNDFKFRENLSARVQSTLCEEEIHFAPYDANQLRPILEHRAQKAFVKDALTEDVIPLTAALVGQDTGSARDALDVLHKAASISRREDLDAVSGTQVREAYDKVERGKIEAELRALPRQTHIILYAIFTLAQQDKTPARRKEIYNIYEALTERLGADTKAPRTIHNRLSQLEMKSFLTSSVINRGRDGGKYYNYELSVPRDMLEAVLRDSDRLEEAMGNEAITSY